MHLLCFRPAPGLKRQHWMAVGDVYIIHHCSNRPALIVEFLGGATNQRETNREHTELLHLSRNVLNKMPELSGPKIAKRFVGSAGATY